MTSAGLLEVVDLNELSLEVGPPCAKRGCEKDAEWRGRRKCCGMSILVCEIHRLAVEKRLDEPMFCRTCHVHPGALAWTPFH